MFNGKATQYAAAVKKKKANSKSLPHRVERPCKLLTPISWTRIQIKISLTDGCLASTLITSSEESPQPLWL